MKTLIQKTVFVAIFGAIVSSASLFAGVEISSTSTAKNELVNKNIKYLSTIDLIVMELTNHNYEFLAKESNFEKFDHQNRKFIATFKNFQINMEEINVNGTTFKHFFVVFKNKAAKEDFLKTEFAATMQRRFESTINTEGNMIVYETPTMSIEQIEEQHIHLTSNQSIALELDNYKGGILSYLNQYFDGDNKSSDKFLVDMVREKSK